jgi:hypothetical protein
LCLPSRLAVCFSAPKQIEQRVRSGNQGVLSGVPSTKLLLLLIFKLYLIIYFI